MNLGNETAWGKALKCDHGQQGVADVNMPLIIHAFMVEQGRIVARRQKESQF